MRLWIFIKQSLNLILIPFIAGIFCKFASCYRTIMIAPDQPIEHFKGPILDYYLSIGWYRMGASLFTTRFITPFQDDTMGSVYWLRYKVGNVHLSPKSQSLLSRNRCFTVEYKPFRLTDEIIALHKAYTANLKFRTSGSLITLLEDLGNNVFDSHIVEIRDCGTLVGAGIFDLGQNSIAGIINFYDPAMSRYSLGKYSILMKYRFCLKNGLPWYYPGYYMPDYPTFDYKLFLDKAATEVFLPDEKIWIPFTIFDKIYHKRP